MLKILNSIICCTILIGCSTVENKATPIPAVSMQKYNTLAMTKFSSPDPAIGGRVAARLAVRFGAEGYTVIDPDKLRKISGKDVLMSSELTPTDKIVLEANGVKAVVYGTIEHYECKTLQEWTWTGFAPEKTDTELCNASLSVKVVDNVTNNIVWQAHESKSEKNPDATARMVLEKVLTKIEDEIPKIH